MRNDVTVVSIFHVFRQGWLQAVFEPVCQELVQQQGRTPTMRAIFGDDLSSVQVRKLNSIFLEGRYPPTSPEDIVGIIRDGNEFHRDYVINETVKHAIALKEILPKHLKTLTGIDFRIA